MVLIAGSVVAAGKLTVAGLPLTITSAFEVFLSTAFAATDQEQHEKNQKKYTTSDRAADDVLLIVRQTRSAPKCELLLPRRTFDGHSRQRPPLRRRRSRGGLKRVSGQGDSIRSRRVGDRLCGRGLWAAGVGKRGGGTHRSAFDLPSELEQRFTLTLLMG